MVDSNDTNGFSVQILHEVLNRKFEPVPATHDLDELFRCELEATEPIEFDIPVQMVMNELYEDPRSCGTPSDSGLNENNYPGQCTQGVCTKASMATDADFSNGMLIITISFFLYC
ncbi:hypothetical protein M5K25_025453 [Dendrobium thyrsiflorum]|uniref:Uncharacterized protein n=1 Tax=Dendrobium thyrsiflorum TaxID=117978 RepID=A0ABD0U4F6_DENTH